MKSGRLVGSSIAVALLFAMLLTFAAARPAAAATIVVDGVTCTLADAITAANTDTATGGCPAGSGADRLDLVADITLTSRLPAIVSEVALQGNGHTVSRLPTAPAFGILEIGSYRFVTIDRITITGGQDGSGGGITVGSVAHVSITNSSIVDNTAGSGGGIDCSICFITLSDSLISDNTATFDGGGIFSSGAFRGVFSSYNGPSQSRPDSSGVWNVLLRNSTLSNNTADEGGGLYTVGVGNFRLESSTVHGNSATLGGGIYNLDGDGSIENSTLSDNTASHKGGAIYNHSWVLQPDHGLIDLRNSTITNNNSPLGSGLYNQDDGSFSPLHQVASLRPYNSIVAAQAGGVDCVNVGGAVVESQGYNIESTTSCGFTATGDQQNVSAAQLNLAPLANNGGPTWTHALTPNSLAIDQGNCPNVTADQRGYPRPIDQIGVPNAADGCDVGAFELQIPTAVTLAQLEAANRDVATRPVFIALLVSLLLVASIGLARRE